jgi:polar amino acid transport system substrate-binding protein/arginine transport system substrate-binding protein/lysine/arginine/ornithine transport system substrate-binding protein/histidine transport system substrate-binding protein
MHTKRDGALRKCLGGLMLGLLSWALPVGAQELVFAVTSSSVPFGYHTPQGELVGFNIDLGRAICEQLKRPCRFEAMPFPLIIPAVNAGRVDIGLGNVLKTPERERQVAFSVPIWRSTSSFVGLAGMPPTTPLQAIKEQTVCVVDGSAQQAYLRTLGGPSPLLIARTSNQAVLEGLQQGACTMALLPTMQVLPFLQSPAGKPYAFIGAPLGQEGLGGTVHMVVRPDRADLLTGVNEAIQTLIRNGTHEKISRRYFPFSIL